MNELKTILLEMEFSAKEADVYIAILSLGRGTASAIAREAHILRTTVYEILSSLFNKGLVTLSGKEPKQECRRVAGQTSGVRCKPSGEKEKRS